MYACYKFDCLEHVITCKRKRERERKKPMRSVFYRSIFPHNIMFRVKKIL